MTELCSIVSDTKVKPVLGHLNIRAWYNKDQTLVNALQHFRDFLLTANALLVVIYISVRIILNMIKNVLKGGINK